MVICLTDEFAYAADEEDKTAAMIVSGVHDGLARVAVVDPEQPQASVVYLNAENAQGLVDFLTKEFDL